MNFKRLIVSLLISLTINAILIINECKNKGADTWCGVFVYFFIPVITVILFILFWFLSALFNKRLTSIGQRLPEIIVWLVLSGGISFIVGLVVFWVFGGILYYAFHLAGH